MLASSQQIFDPAPCGDSQTVRHCCLDREGRGREEGRREGRGREEGGRREGRGMEEGGKSEGGGREEGGRREGGGREEGGRKSQLGYGTLSSYTRRGSYPSLLLTQP